MTSPTPPAAATSTPPTANAVSSGGDWSFVANENEVFDVGQSRVVRYGVDDSWVHKAVAGPATCSNSFFGTDPMVGQVKRCEARAGAAAAVSAPAQPAPAPAPTPAAVSTTPAVAVTPPAAAPAPSPTLGNSLASARVLISGHSLVDDPLGQFMSSIAQSMSTPMWWNQQIVLGSPIRVRTRGENPADASFSGYRTGKNRSGSGLDMVSELANPQTIGGERYDTLLLAERHDLASVLMWEDTVRYARHYHERLISGNARANTYLYHAWLAVSNKDDPSAWIAYERAAAPAWQCVAARVNLSLAGLGRPDRMATMPAGLALANLVEQATRGGVAGVSGGSVRETMNRLFVDDVHLTHTGVYYMALVSYASVYRRSPVGAWAPPEVTSQQARALQDIAWQSVANYFNNASAPTMSQCQALMREQYCSAFAAYAGKAGTLAGCVSRFSQQSRDNPFYYDAGTDAGYWFPAPR